MSYVTHDTTLSTIVLSTGDTDYLVWETYGATDQSIQLAWTGSGVTSTAVEVTNRADVSNAATTGWQEVTGLSVPGPSGVSAGSWRRLQGAVAKRARVKLVHNSGSTVNVSAWVVRADPRFP